MCGAAIFWRTGRFPARGPAESSIQRKNDIPISTLKYKIQSGQIILCSSDVKRGSYTGRWKGA